MFFDLRQRSGHLRGSNKLIAHIFVAFTASDESADEIKFVLHPGFVAMVTAQLTPLHGDPRRCQLLQMSALHHR